MEHHLTHPSRAQKDQKGRGSMKLLPSAGITTLSWGGHCYSWFLIQAGTMLLASPGSLFADGRPQNLSNSLSHKPIPPVNNFIITSVIYNLLCPNSLESPVQYRANIVFIFYYLLYLEIVKFYVMI